MPAVRKPARPKLRLGIPVEELVAALKEMDDEDREWFLENLLAATSPDYLKSIREAREDYQQGRTVTAEDVFQG
ncbi:MAG: hypothetical protein HYY01_15690 [Chloroflexi bacterium]|nr:hypothetical protein [Chloroflexota bacterium]